MAAVSGVAILAGAPAAACFNPVRLDLRLLSVADAVVVGTLPAYEVVPFGAGDPGGDYARLTIDVREVLRGQVPDRLVVTWDGHSFDDAADPGQERAYIIALRREGGYVEASGSSEDTLGSRQEPDRMTVMEAWCAGSYLFAAEGPLADAIRQILDDEGEAESEAAAFAEAFGLDGRAHGVPLPDATLR